MKRNLTLRWLSLLALACAATAPVRAFDPSGARPADAPWKIHQTTQARFPMLLMRTGITHGEARVRVSIGSGGELLDAITVACSHGDFGEEALRAIKQWHYEPDRVKGEPIGVVGDVAFEFFVNGTVAIEKRTPAANEDLADPGDSPGYRARGLRDIDRIPTPAHVVPPVYPQEWSDRGITGTVKVEFYIDESGRVRIPVVTAKDHRLLAASAIAAVSQWRFEPPTRMGRPVLVLAEQTFAFEPGKK